MHTIQKTLFSILLALPFAGCGAREASVEQRSEVAECVFTQGYWKNHPTAWPVQSLTLGTVTYTKNQLLAIFNTPVKGNGLIQLAHQLIAAKLNVLNGGDTSIDDEIASADAVIGGLVVPPIGSGTLPTGNALVGELDDYNNNGECAPAPACGDGHVDAGEQCDDGNTAPGDGCAADCQNEPPPPCCGDGHVDAGEQCDDGNTAPGDGCSATCQNEPPPPCCGDGHVDAGEQCDDGNTAPGDGCSATCQNEPPPPCCGDGHVDAGEQCDDGNTTSGDGCSATCQRESCTCP